jgi:hypothetical protein
MPRDLRRAKSCGKKSRSASVKIVKIVLGTKLAKPIRPDQGDDVDSRRVRLQLRLIETVMRAARPADRKAIQDRAKEILDDVPRDIEATADPELAELFARVRSQLAEPPG